MGQIHAYLAISLDSFIASEDGGVEWLSQFEGIDYGYRDFLAGIGTIIMGRDTFDQILTFGAWPYVDQDTFVVTSGPLKDPPPRVEAWQGDLEPLIDRLRAFGSDTWMCGGAKIIEGFRRYGGIDTWRIYVMPLLLGRGIPLFLPFDRREPVRLISHRSFENGVVELIYEHGSGERRGL